MLVTVMQIYEYNYHLCNKYQRIYLLFFCLKILSRSFVGKTSCADSRTKGQKIMQNAVTEISPPCSRRNDKTLVLLSASLLAVGRMQYSHPSASKLALLQND